MPQKNQSSEHIQHVRGVYYEGLRMGFSKEFAAVRANAVSEGKPIPKPPKGEPKFKSTREMAPGTNVPPPVNLHPQDQTGEDGGDGNQDNSGSGVKPPGENTDLTIIKGIGPGTVTKLNDMGVTTVEQIASWGEAEIEHFDKALGLHGRIGRTDWVGQAKEALLVIEEEDD